MALEKRVSYNATAAYYTVNTLSEKTKNIWLVFHGMGYLSRYFTRYFSDLNSEENFIIAPQAPSKYYIGPEFKHVGASWLTREDTSEETKNVLNYIDAVCEAEPISSDSRFIVLGYSQGVSIASRWLASRKIQCDHLILHSGGIPKELKPEDFDYMHPETDVTYIYGDKDEYITEARKTEETLRGSNLFRDKLKIEVFDGIHEVSGEFLQKIAHN
ncbi:MAG: esterase [Bacteroidia bacterium]|nr:esterase [Bacteroidia bacterium]MBT8276969.1 esterase [Bacteroidia bacterium]NNJ81772.1 esterase [Flavobacteriaceae bacterium]NNK55300.1 esterase [Flavobacteriaceae bacterium]